MAISVFPTPTTPSTISNTITAVAANTLYVGTVSMTPGVYTITCTSGTIAAISFFDATDTYIGQTKTSSGTVQYNLGTAASKIRYSIDTGSNVLINIQLTGYSVTGSGTSGTLDTITTTSTYNQTGRLYVIAIGGGGGGASGRGPNGPSFGGGGGKAGTITEAWTTTNAPTSVTIGAQGNGGGPSLTNTSGGFAGNAGGTTSFGNITAAGGAGGLVAATGTGSGGADGTSVYVFSNFVINQGQIGNGGDGGGGNNGGLAGGLINSIGRGGAGASGNNINGGAAAGYGSGGGGGASQINGVSNTGGAGTPGVVYVLRGAS